MLVSLPGKQSTPLPGNQQGRPSLLGEVEMSGLRLHAIAAVAIGIVFLAPGLGAAQAQKSASPGWFMVPSAKREATPAQSNPMAGCAGDVAKLCTGLNGAAAHFCLSHNSEKLSGQ